MLFERGRGELVVPEHDPEILREPREIIQLPARARDGLGPDVGELLGRYALGLDDLGDVIDHEFSGFQKICDVAKQAFRLVQLGRVDGELRSIDHLLDDRFPQLWLQQKRRGGLCAEDICPEGLLLHPESLRYPLLHFREDAGKDAADRRAFGLPDRKGRLDLLQFLDRRLGQILRGLEPRACSLLDPRLDKPSGSGKVRRGFCGPAHEIRQLRADSRAFESARDRLSHDTLGDSGHGRENVLQPPEPAQYGIDDARIFDGPGHRALALLPLLLHDIPCALDGTKRGVVPYPCRADDAVLPLPLRLGRLVLDAPALEFGEDGFPDPGLLLLLDLRFDLRALCRRSGLRRADLVLGGYGSDLASRLLPGRRAHCPVRLFPGRGAHARRGFSGVGIENAAPHKFLLRKILQHGLLLWRPLGHLLHLVHQPDEIFR